MNKQAKTEVLKAFYKTKGLDLSLDQVDVLQEVASRAQALSLRNCNGNVVEAEYERQIAKMHARLGDALGEAKSFVKQIVGDPRGYTLKLEINGQTIHPQFYND